MSPQSRLPRRVALLLASSLLAGVVVGCDESAPSAATAALEGALSALSEQDAEAFVATLPPSQREGAKELPEWPNFMAIEEAKVGSASEVESDSLKMTTMLYFAEDRDTFSTVTFVLTKEGDEWFLDLKETIALQKRLNGPDAFSAWTYDPQ